MKLSNNLQGKLLLQILSAVVGLYITTGVIVALSNRQVAKSDAYRYSKLEAEKNAQYLKSILEKHAGFVNYFSDLLVDFASSVADSGEFAYESLMLSQVNKHNDYTSVWSLWNSKVIGTFGQGDNGWLLVEAKQINNSVQFISTIPEFGKRFGEIVLATTDMFSDPYLIDGKYYIDFASPVFSKGQKVGYAGITLSLTFLEDFVEDLKGSDSEDISVLSSNGLTIANINSQYIGRLFNENFPDIDAEYFIERKLKLGKEFDVLTKSQNGKSQLCFSPVYISNCPKPLIVEASISYNELLQAAKKSVVRSVVLALAVLVFIIFVIIFSARRISRPIKKVTRTLQLLSVGNTSEISEFEIQTNDEIQEMNESLNKVVDGLRKTENFALEIGKGNLEEEFSVLGDSDHLGKALLQMRSSLKENQVEHKKRQQEEEIRSWTNTGIAKFSDILRQNNDNLKKLGFNVMSNLIEYLKVNQGALFVLNEENEKDHYFELVTAIAYSREKFMKKDIRIGEGLVGRAVFEKKTIYLTEVPENYHNITSGLGTANPTCVLIVPCVLNDIVYSVIEIAAFTKLEDHEIKFVELFADSVASTISSVRINEKTSFLLENSQKQSEELAAQEEELRQNLEEMEATQEDLQRQIAQNNLMRENLIKQNALLDALLLSLPDYIYFKDKESKFLRVSESMLELFNAETVDEVVGKSDFDFQKRELAEIYFADEQKIMKTREGFTDKIQKEELRDGSIKWMTVSKLPLVDSDGNVFGTFGISKDVTQIKKFEIEANAQREAVNKQKALLDALLRSLPDFIYFKDTESKFIRISESMLTIFNASSVKEIEGKSDFDFQDKESAQKYYEEEKEIMRSRKGFADNIIKEVMRNGDERWMSISKLPLINDHDEVIGTFGISKNVTEIKKFEIETKVRNEELLAQEEELKQNLEELEAVNEHNAELKKQIEQHSKMMLDLLNELPFKIFVKDNEGKFVIANNKVAANFGKTPSEIIGKSDFDFYPKAEAEKYFKIEQKIIKEGKTKIYDEGDKDKYDGLLVRSIKKPFKIANLDVTGLMGLQLDPEVWNMKSEE